MHQRNVVVLIGRLAADPVLRYTNQGAAVASFGIAVNHPIPQGDGKFEDKLDGFFDCEVWNALGEEVAETLHKGDEIYVCGALIQNKFKPKGSDQTVSRLIVRSRRSARPSRSPARRREEPARAEEPVGAVA